MGALLTYLRIARQLVTAAALLAALGAMPAFAVESPKQIDVAPNIAIGEDSSTHDREIKPGHEDEAVESAEDHKSGGLPQLDFTTYTPQLFWMAIIFAVLYFVMAKKALPEVGAIVENRRSMIDTNLKGAETLRADANGIQTGYESNLDRAHAEALKAVQDVEATAAAKAAAQVEAFRKRSDIELSAAEARVLAAKQQAMGQMTAVAADVASLAAEKITGVAADRENAQIIVETIAGKAKAA